jgi:hypothetical protein
MMYPTSLLLPGILTIQAGNVSLPTQRLTLPEPIVAPITAPKPQAKFLSTPLSSLYIRFNGMKSFLTNTYILNPTGGQVRRIGMDAWGGGEYLARRYDPKTRVRSWHNAVDYLGKPQQAVRAPISGELRRIGRGMAGGAMISGHVNGKRYVVRILHFDVGVKNGYVVQGQTIGRLKNLSRWHRGMLSHAHLEVLEVQRRGLKQRNPSLFVRNKSE